MKIRNGFVSNSSSTSFYCPVCRTHFSGWDWDEDPVCPECNVHINDANSFDKYLCDKYNLNIEEELESYKNSVRNP